jgi:hypothetical protein
MQGVPGSEKALRDESGEIRGLKINTPRDNNAMPAFVAAAIPNNSQTSTSLGDQ